MGREIDWGRNVRRWLLMDAEVVKSPSVASATIPGARTESYRTGDFVLLSSQRTVA
jgi:hypothetical protein